MQNYSTSPQPTVGGSTSPTKQTTTTTDYTSPGKWTTTTTTTTSYLGTGSYLSGLPAAGYTTSQIGTDYGNQTSYSSPGGLRTSISASTLGSEGKYYDTTSNPSLPRDYTASYTSVNRPDYQSDLTSRIYTDTSPSKLAGLYTSGIQGFSTLTTNKSPESSPTTQRTSYSTSLPQGKEELSQSFIRLQSTNSPQALSTINLGRAAENTEGTPTYYPGSASYTKKTSPEMSPKYRSLQKDILDRVQRAKDTVDKTLSNSKTQSPSLRSSQQLGREFSATVEGLKTSDIADSPSKRAQAEEERLKRSSAPSYHLSSVDKILAEIKSPGFGDTQSLSASTNLNQRFSDVAGSSEVTTLKEENQSLRGQIAELKASHEQQGEKVKRAALPAAHSEESQAKVKDLESQVNSLTTEIEQLRSSSAHAEQKHSEATSSSSKLEAQLLQLQKENEALQGKTAEIDRLTQELNTHKASSTELQAEVRQLSEARNLLDQQELLPGIQSLIQSNNTLKGELDQHLKQHGSSSEVAETRIRELEQAKVSAEEQVKKLTASLDEANSQLSHSKQGSESQLTKLEDERSALLQQIHLLVQESSSSNVQHAHIENIHNAELRSLFEQISKTKSDLNQLRESENAKIQEISQLTQANQTLNGEIASHKSQSTQAEGSLKAAEQQKNQRIAELEAQISHLQNEKSSDHTKISELTNSIKNLESNSDENTKNLIHQVQTLTGEKASLESKVSSLQNENKTVTQELTSSRGSQEGKFNEERVLLQKQVTHAEEQLQAAKKEALDTRTSLQNKVAQLESEKAEVERKFYENQGLANKSQGELNDILSSLKSTKEIADREKQTYEKELAQARAQIETLKQEIAQLKANHENEFRSLKETKATLEQELRKSGERETNTQASAKADTQKLQESLKKAQDENSKLRQEIQAKESSPQKQKQDDGSKKVKDLENKLAKLTTEREKEQKKFTDLETESRLKDKQIEGLKYDISQMKGFIYQHHNESLFEQNEHGEEQKGDNIKFTVPSETSFTQDLLGSFIAGSEWETGSIKRSQPKNQPQAKAAKASRTDLNDSMRSTEIIISQTASKTQPASVKTVKTKKTKDQDPIHARYEAIIKELNEKISNIDKSRKKDAEVKALEVGRQYIEKEEKLAVEIEALKQQNAALLKKIEDIEWNKAYEFTQKSKKDGAPPQTQPEPVQAVPADTEGKKKKKKKKNKNKTEKSKDESDAE